MADYAPPAVYERPASWGDEGRPKRYNTYGSPAKSGRAMVPGHVQPKTAGPTKYLDLGPDEYTWLPDRQPLPRTPAQKRRFLDAARRALGTAKLFAKYAMKVHPYLKALDYTLDAYDAYQWYRQAARPATFTPAPGYGCYHAAPSIDKPSLACNFEYHLGSIAAWTYDCNWWHYSAQALPAWYPPSRGVVYGPKLGGIYGCQRMNMVHVAIYPDGFTGDKTPKVTPYWPARTMVAPRQVIPLPLEVQSGRLPRSRQPALKPYEEPSSAYAIPPPGGRGWPVRTLPHAHLPPPKRKRERKGGVRDTPTSRGIAAAMNFYGKWTEFGDLVDAFWKALPRKYRTKNANTFQKSRDLYEHWKHLDYGAGIGNFIEGQAKDMIFGKLGEGAKKLAQHPYWVRPVGPDSGGAYTRNIGRFSVKQ